MQKLELEDNLDRLNHRYQIVNAASFYLSIQIYLLASFWKSKVYLNSITRYPFNNSIMQTDENEALKIINRKVKDSNCGNSCSGFKYIVINCSKYSYNYLK